GWHDDLPWDSIAACLRALSTNPWEPSLACSGDTGQPHAYAPYWLTQLPGAQPQTSISAALETYYAAREQITDHRQRRDAIEQQLETSRERLQHQLAQIMRELERTTDVEYLRWEGEMIFAFLHGIAPGQTSLDVEGKAIALDPGRSSVEQAQERFNTYTRARSGRETLQTRRQQTEVQLAGLEQIAALLTVATEREQIDQLALEAAEQGYLPSTAQNERQKKQQAVARKRLARRKPLHLVSSDGYDIYVGRSAAQNAEVTFKVGRPDDLWLHVRAIPGAHVIIRSGGREVPEPTVREAAGLAAYFSKAHTEAMVDVEISHRRHVRKIPGAAPGLVTYRAERTIRVPPLPPWG
ncbi:MAG: DUF814 domain-containing protein, partial [Chloroflexaceae bacterium]|nr:DUF814 domain-containing protein [Chloroflexaceae bacterium]